MAICSMVLKETISYTVNHGSSEFYVFLDATKAFDRVQNCSLFDKLTDTSRFFDIQDGSRPPC